MKMRQAGDKLMSLQINKSWQYLAYLYLLLPGVLFALGYFLREQALGKTFAALFHNYGLFAVSTIPNLSNLTGLVGLGLAAWFLFAAVRRRDWLDLGLSAGLVGLNTLYFYFELNYRLLNLLPSL